MSQILNESNTPQWWCLLLLMLISFVIGYVLARWLTKRDLSTKIRECQEENRKLKGFIKTSDEEEPISAPKKIMAVKTRDRSGNLIEYTPEIDFNRIGNATKEQRDNLKKLSGVGPSTENKLNKIGIYTFDQISKLSNEDIDAITKLIDFIPGKILKDNWQSQAQGFISITDDENQISDEVHEEE